MISPDGYILPTPAVIDRIIEDEAVLVLSEQGQVKVLNEVGARIWALAQLPYLPRAFASSPSCPTGPWRRRPHCRHAGTLHG